jgi:hypothetical protein
VGLAIDTIPTIVGRRRRATKATIRLSHARIGVLVTCVAAACGLLLETSVASDRPPKADKLVAPGGYYAFCGGAPSCPPGHVPAALRRRLHVPRIKRGARCPVSAPGKTVTSYYAPAIGEGPVYAVSLYSLARSGVLPFDYPPRLRGLFYGSSWSGQALKWIADPAYDGPVLIRGRQLNGRHRVGFGNGIVPYSEMQVPPGTGDPQVDGWRGWGGYARFRVPGCYGIQVDGTDFSEVIVFKAVAIRRAR